GDVLALTIDADYTGRLGKGDRNMTCEKDKWGHHETCDSWRECWCDAIAIDPATTRIVRTIEGAIANIVDKRTEGIYGFKLDREDAELIALARLAEELAVKVGITLDPIRHDERSEEHTSELQSRENLVCRLLLEKKTKEQH